MKLNGILQIFLGKISKDLKRSREKSIHQMVYGILAGHKLHLSEIARSLKNITLKKTIDWLSKNLNTSDDKDSLMHSYLSFFQGLFFASHPFSSQYFPSRYSGSSLCSDCCILRQKRNLIFVIAFTLAGAL